MWSPPSSCFAPLYKKVQMTDLPVFILLGRPRQGLSIEELESEQSKITGSALRRLRVSLWAEGDLEGQLRDELKPPASGGNAFISDTSGGKWRVGNYSSYYTQGQSRKDYTINLDEHEDLTLTGVEFDELSIVPDRFTFDAHDHPVTLTIMITLDHEQNEHFERFLLSSKTGGGYFPVRQIGVSSEPILMRFGRCYWEPLGEGKTRHVITLVSQTGDVDDGDLGILVVVEPEVSRLKEASIKGGRKVDALIQELHRAGVLSNEAIQRISDFAKNPPAETLREFDRAHNVEAFMD